jgi:predicted helicase
MDERVMRARLQSVLISKEEIEHKYHNEIFANEIVLLAYYIAAINIESTFSELNANEYTPFDGIVLTDTFQMFESKDVLDLEVFSSNNNRAELQKAQNIKVIIGNPPYSVGQKDAGESNQNMSYEDLDARVAETYVKSGTSRSTKKAMYEKDTRFGLITEGTDLPHQRTDSLRKGIRRTGLGSLLRLCRQENMKSSSLRK